MSGRRKAALFLGVLTVLWLLGRGTGGAGSDSTPTAGSASTAPASTGAPSGTPASVKPSPASKPGAPRPSATATSRAGATAGPGSALAAVESLPVRGRAPMTGYTREEFGQAWLDADRNGCDTRNDILRRDVSGAVIADGTHGCVVLSGVLHDPYLGRDVPFVRGPGDQVDIDHVVALGNAWVTGAARFGIRTRAALANDPLNLLAVDQHSNRSKGDGDAATWVPPYRPFRCAYVARQVAVKQKYGLWVTAPERDAIIRVLSGCPGERLPTDRTHAPTAVDQNVSDPAAPPSAAPPVSGGGTVYYRNCDAVRAAGAAPIHRGDPGYSSRLDRDGDGIGCE